MLGCGVEKLYPLLELMDEDEKPLFLEYLILGHPGWLDPYLSLHMIDFGLARACCDSERRNSSFTVHVSDARS